MPRIGLGLPAIVLAFAGGSPAWSQASPSPFTHGTRYDAMRRVVGTIAPYPGDGSSTYYPAVRNTYDADGRLTKVETGTLSAWQPETVAPSAWGAAFTVLRTVDMTYDVMDRKLTDKLTGTSVTHKLTQYSYDVVGRLQCTAVRMNPAAFGALPASACTLGTQGSDGPDRITKNFYDPVGQLLQVQEAFGVAGQQRNQVTYTYTPDGKQEFVTDANGNKAQFAYDGFDRRSAWYFPSRTTPGVVNTSDFEAYGYDANNNRTSLTRRDGTVISYTYDALNRMTLKHFPAGSLSSDTAYTYDYRSLMLSALYTPGGAGISFSYDNAGRTLTTTNTMTTSRTISYQWDADGNRIRRTDPDGIYFTTDYDGIDRATTTHENSAAASLFTLSYDALSRRSGITRANGTSTAYVYDAADRLSSLTQNFNSTANNLTLTFTYNADDQVLTRTLTSNNTAFSYPNSTNGSKAYAPNGLNQYGSVAGVTYGYDANGNMTSNGSDTYTYDGENRIRVVNGSHNVLLTYDPLGRLTKVDASAPNYLLFDGDDLIGEFDGTTGVQNRRYVTGPGDDDPQVWYQGANLTSDRRFHHADEQGSIIGISNAAGLLAVNSYDEYGTPSTTTTGIYKYTGQLFIAQAGLYYYKARMYDPHVGRFLQVDPVGYDGGFNLYGYGSNDPTNESDSSGLCTGSLFSGANGGCTTQFGKGPADISWSDAAAIARNIGTSPQVVAAAFQNLSQGGGFQLASSRGIVGTFPAKLSTPPIWDPMFMMGTYTPTPGELTEVFRAYAKAYASITAGRTRTPYPENMHSYQNRPDPVTGAILPPPVGRYVTVYVGAGAVPGKRRLVVDTGAPAGVVWYSPEHYRAFIMLKVVPK